MITMDTMPTPRSDNYTRFRSRMVKAATPATEYPEDAAHDAIVEALSSTSYDPEKDKKGAWLCRKALNHARWKRRGTRVVNKICCPTCGRMVKEGTACQCGLGIPKGLVPAPDEVDYEIVPDCWQQFEDWQRDEEHIMLKEALLETVPEWLREAMFLIYVDCHKTIKEVADLYGEDHTVMMIQIRGAKRRMKRMARLLHLIQ